MKTKIDILLITIVLLTSCSGFLDKDPMVQSSAETYYSTEAEANDAIIGIYSIQQNEGFELCPFLWIGDDCSDDYDLGNSESEAYSWAAPTARQMQSFQTLSNNWLCNALWGQAFRGIKWATTAIERISANTNIPEGKRNQFIGEATYMRAYYYFYLARQYGGQQLVDHTLTYDEYYMPRATLAETWDFITKDLIEAAKLLPEKSDIDAANVGRATRGAANALLGRTYMYAHKYQEAYDALKLVETSGEYNLESKYEDIFTLENENGIESIFEIQHSTSNTGWADSNEGSILSFYEHDADKTDPVKWHNGWSMHCPTQDLVDAYEPGDPRLHATIIFPNENFDGRINKNAGSSTGYQSKKWYIPYAQRSQIDQSDCPKNIIFYRYADVLLYLAEAANELGKTGEALGYLEQVRGRARANAVDPSTALPQITEQDKEKLRNLIWQERRVEFAGEGQRFWDLVRQGRAGVVMKAYAAKYAPTIKGTHFQEGISEIFPIPADEVSRSHGTLEQNPGYN